MAEKNVPKGRVQRLARVGSAAASSAVKQTGTRAANLTRSDEKAQKASERRQVETAKQIVTVLGDMKGAAMKVGQVLSFIDVGIVPEEYREEFQAELAKLRDAAPKVSFDQMRKVIEEDLGEKITDVFSDVRRGGDRRRLDRPGLPGDACATTAARSRSRSSTRASTRRSGPT